MATNDLGEYVYQRRVVCAACMHKDGAIVLGVRHFDSIIHSNINIRKEINEHEDWYGCDQGFIDNHGEFMTRDEAWIVASNAKQIVRRVGGDTANGGTLYSENIY